MSVLTGAIPIVTLEREEGREGRTRSVFHCCQIIQSLENKFLNFSRREYLYYYLHAVNGVSWRLCLCCVAMYVSERLNYAWETS